MAKRETPCTGFEFAVRRAAAGLDNASMIAIASRALTPLAKCSVSALTKWNAGHLPVSHKAYATLTAIEEAIEEEILRIIEDIERQADEGRTALIIITPSASWSYGSNTHAVAASRARVTASLSHGEKIRIEAPERNRSAMPRYLHRTVRPVTDAC